MSKQHTPEQLTLVIDDQEFRFTPLKHWHNATIASETYMELLKLEKAIAKDPDSAAIWEAICAEIDS